MQNNNEKPESDLVEPNVNVRRQELVDVYKITCIDGDYKEIAEVSIRKEYINREDALEIALNILVDEINKNSLSLVGKAFRVRSDKLSNTVESK